MTSQKTRDQLNSQLEQLHLEQVLEDMTLESDSVDESSAQVSIENAMARVLASLDRFERGELVGGEAVSEASTDLTAPDPFSAPPAFQIPSPLDIARRGLRILLDSLSPMPDRAAQGLRRDAADPVTMETKLRALGSKNAPTELLWVPVAGGETDPGMAVIFQWRGEGSAIAPTVVLQVDGAFAEPVAVEFRTEDGGLVTVVLPPIGADTRQLGVLTPDTGTLVLSMERPDESGGAGAAGAADGDGQV